MQFRALIGFGVNVRKESVPEMLTGMAACLDEMAGTTIPRRKVLVRFCTSSSFVTYVRTWQARRIARAMEELFLDVERSTNIHWKR